MQPTRVYAEALGYCEIPATHTPYLSLFRPKITKRKLQFALSDSILGGNHYFLFPIRKPTQYGNMIYFILAVSCAFLLLLVVATAFSRLLIQPS